MNFKGLVGRLLISRQKPLQTKEISSWSELLNEVYEDTWDPAIRRYRSSWVFRGVGDRAFGLDTGLARLSNGYRDISMLERNLLRNFRKYASADLPDSRSDWRLLPFAQHHGLPTRLLDWSFSPLIAAHFATVAVDYHDRDGALWCFNIQSANCSLPDCLKKLLSDEGADVFTAEMLEDAAPGLDRFDALSEDPVMLFLEPPSIDMRIANQFALFSVLSGAGSALSDWLRGHEDAAREIVIRASAKQEIRDKLDQTGITERMIYPGADGIARWLRRYYQPTPQDVHD